MTCVSFARSRSEDGVPLEDRLAALHLLRELYGSHGSDASQRCVQVVLFAVASC